MAHTARLDRATAATLVAAALMAAAVALICGLCAARCRPHPALRAGRPDRPGRAASNRLPLEWCQHGRKHVLHVLCGAGRDAEPGGIDVPRRDAWKTGRRAARPPAPA